MSLTLFFAQTANATNAALPLAADATNTQPQSPLWVSVVMWIPVVVAFYFLLIRPQSVAARKKEEVVKGAKTGDKIVTTSGIHAVISNVKESTVIVKVSDNVKLEIEKTHIDKITRPSAEADKQVAAKA